MKGLTGRMDRISTILVTGLTGSGRTTLIQHLLATLPAEARCAVCVHQHAKGFGLEAHYPTPYGFDPDDERLAVYFEVYDFGSGCICCSPDGDLTRLLCQMGRERERDGLSVITHLLIETTGIADPRPFTRLLSAEAYVCKHFRLDRVVSVVELSHGLSSISCPSPTRKVWEEQVDSLPPFRSPTPLSSSAHSYHQTQAQRRV